MVSNVSLASRRRRDLQAVTVPGSNRVQLLRSANEAPLEAMCQARASGENTAGTKNSRQTRKPTTELTSLPMGVAPLGPVPLVGPAPHCVPRPDRSLGALEHGTSGPVLLAPLEIRVLGSLRVFGIRGQGLGSIAGRHQLRNLLTLLAANPTPLPAERVMDMLWPQFDVPRARNRLHNCLNTLRGSLGELAWDDNWIRVEKGTLVLDARIRTDAGVLEDAVAQGLHLYPDDQLLELADLCAGRCTDEIGSDESLRSIKDRLDLLQTLVLRAAVTRMDAVRHIMPMRELLQRLLQIHPMDEWALERLVDLELRGQQRQRALRTLQEAERMMKCQLGASAPKKLREQLQRTQDLTAAAATRPHGATPPERLMLGRDDLIAPMLDQIDLGPALWNIHGAPGVGKQALLNCLSERLDSRFRILRLNLASPPQTDLTALQQLAQPTAGDDRPLVLMVCAQDVPLAAANTWLQANVHHLQERRTLVLSTCALQAAGIRHLPLAPLDVPPCGATHARVRLSAAVNLLLALCPDLDPGQQGATAWSTLADVVRELDGYPQALNLAANRLRSLTLAEVRDELHPEAPTPHWLKPCIDALQVHLQRDVLPALPEDVARWLLSTASLPRAAQVGDCDAGTPPLLDQLLALNLLRRDPLHQTWALALLPGRALRALAQRQGHALSARRRWAQHLAQQTPPPPSLESPRYLSWLEHTLPLQASLEEALKIAWPQDMQSSQQLLRPLCALWACGANPEHALAWTTRLLQATLSHAIEPSLNRQLRLTHAAVLISQHQFAVALPLIQDLLQPPPTPADDDAQWPEQHAHAQALHAQASAALGTRTTACRALQEALRQVPEGQTGHWLLTAALLGLDAPLSPSKAHHQTEPHMRAHLQGSWVWLGLMAALSTPSSDPQPSACTRATSHAIELQQTGYRLGLHWLSDLGGLQQHRLAHAIGHKEQARLCLIDWYHASLSEGRDLAAVAAALLLCTRDPRASSGHGHPEHWLQHAQALALTCKPMPKAWQALVLTRQTLQQLEQGGIDHACQAYTQAATLLALQPEAGVLQAMLESAQTLLRSLNAPWPIYEQVVSALRQLQTNPQTPHQQAAWSAVAACHMHLLLRPSTATRQATALQLSTRPRRPAMSEQRRLKDHVLQVA